MIIASASERHGGIPNFHTVHSVNFFDVEGPASDKNKMKDEDDEFKSAGKKFTFKSEDLLHMINPDSDLAHNSTRAIDAYNDQLIAHNTRYAKLIGNVYRNQHLATSIGSSFPTDDFMADLNNKIDEYRTIQTAFTQHYQGIIGTFKGIVKELKTDGPERPNEWTLVAEEERIFG